MPSPAEVHTFPSTSTRKPSDTPRLDHREDARVAQPAAAVDDVEDEDVVVAALDPGPRRVRNVEHGLVRRERQSVGVDHLVGDDRELARDPVQPEDEAAAQLGLGPRGLRDRWRSRTADR